LGITGRRQIVANLAGPESELANELAGRFEAAEAALFLEIPIDAEFGAEALVERLREVVLKGWIDSRRLSSEGVILPCDSSNCGGYTLEAELGVLPSGSSEPDFLGWEVKQFSAPAAGPGSGVITLMTPEPSGGIYTGLGVMQFLREFGYPDRSQTERLNFSSPHRVGVLNPRTGLTLKVKGSTGLSGTWGEAGAALVLVDGTERAAAEWPMAKLLEHWSRKHRKAVYITSAVRKTEARQYRYGPHVRTCEGANFEGFVTALINGAIFYDPGIRGNLVTEKTKRRNQFRARFKATASLYAHHRDWILE
jgi:hypothetical protein